MGILEKSMLDSESVVLRTREGLGWLALGENRFFYWCGVGLFIGLEWYAVALLAGLAMIVSWRSREFAVTDKRLVQICGILFSSMREMPLHRVESVKVHQSLVARIFGYGNLVVTGIGGSKEVFVGIKDPWKVRRLVLEGDPTLGLGT